MRLVESKIKNGTSQVSKIFYLYPQLFDNQRFVDAEFLIFNF